MPRKKTLLAIHRWIGLVAGVFLMLQGVSGIVSVWRDELLALSLPPVPPSERGAVAIDRIVAEAQAAHPKAALKRIDFLPDGRPVTLIADARLLTFAPASGRMLSDRALASYPSEVVYRWHAQMLMGEAGRWFVAADAVALLSIVVTGPWFWWPGRKHAARTLKIKAKGPVRRFVAELHRVAGVYLATLFGIVALTGLILALMPQIRTRLAAAGAIRSVMRPVAGNGQSTVSLEEMIRRARKPSGGAEVRSLRFPSGDLNTVRVILNARNGQDWAHDDVWFDRTAGRIMAVIPAASAQPGERMLDWILPVHAGFALGMFGRLLAVALGASLVGLAGSGMWMWWRRTRLRQVPPMQR